MIIIINYGVLVIKCMRIYALLTLSYSCVMTNITHTLFIYN